MDDASKDFLERLSLKKHELEETLFRLMEKQREFNDQHTGNDINDESDHAQHELSVSCNCSMMERKVKELKLIDSLIKRVSKDGRFGLCEECGMPIPPERLLILPEACLCLKCQKETERLNTLRSTKQERPPSRWEYGGTGIWDPEDNLDDVHYDVLDTELDINSNPDRESSENSSSNPG
jgi:RNA polymerase-binding transcription factor DksA